MSENAPNHNNCTFCGAPNPQRVSEIRNVEVPFADPTSVRVFYDVCDNCGFDLEAEENNDIINAAIKQAKKQSVLNIIKWFSDNGVTMSYMERVLDLPIRTMARWKNGDFSAPALALLRIIGVYPWILDVAEQQYSQEAVIKELKFAALIVETNTSSYCEDNAIVVASEFGTYSNSNIQSSSSFDLQTQYQARTA